MSEKTGNEAQIQVRNVRHWGARQRRCLSHSSAGVGKHEKIKPMLHLL